MGSAWGKGVREDPAPQEAGKISSQRSARADQHGQGRRRRPGKSDLMKKDQREQSERFFFTSWKNHIVNVIMIAELIVNHVSVSGE